MMKKNLCRKLIVYPLPALLLILTLPSPEARAQQNDIPAGAGKAEIAREDETNRWWKGLMNRPGDIDWYRLEVENPIKLMMAFEKPPQRDFYCRLYSEFNYLEPLIEVRAADIGEPFAGYTTIDLEPGKYYMKISGVGGDYSRGEDENYQYALLEAPRKKPSEEEQGDQPPEERPEPDQPEEGELDPEDVERLLDAMLSEEEDQRAEMREMEQGETEEVGKDW